MTRQRTLGLAGVLVLVVSAGMSLTPVFAGDAPSTLIPLEDFARAPQFQSGAISPDGTRIATIEMLDGRAAIYVGALGEGERQVVYRNADRSLNNVTWSPDSRFLLTLQDNGGDEGYHLFRLDPTVPGDAVDLTPFKGVQAELIRTSGQRTGAIAISLNRRDPQYSDAYSLDIATGTLALQIENPGKFTEYFAGSSGKVVAASAITSSGNFEIWSVDGGPSRWARRYVAPATTRFKALALSPDGSSLLAKTDQGRSTEGLIAIPLASGSPTLLPSGKLCDRFDVTDVIIGASGIDGSTCASTRTEIEATEPSLASAVAEVRRLSGDDSNISLESRSLDGQTVMLFADKGDRPGRFFLKIPGRPARLYAETRPWLAHRVLATPRAYWVRARDGLPLLTYVTHPLADRRPGPTVIAIHGGPWSRDTGGYEGETQLLASRGYTVIQVNFRGSTGLGRRTYEGGVGEFGRKMSDDIDDVFSWAVQTSNADRERTCVLGGPYGGFAALTALTRDHIGYRCGVDYAGPVDLETLIRAFPPSWKPFLPRSWYRFVGDPTDPVKARMMHDRSPLTHVEQIRAPLMIFQGANDPRVTQAQSDQMVCSLRRRGIAVDYLLASNEGHSFGNEETGLAVNRALELFLANQLQGRAQESVGQLTEQALVTMRRAGDSIACQTAK
ncbi:MAG: prolyl oligopeptidase family serine peptidase [Thermomicrobiales bacterium]